MVFAPKYMWIVQMFPLNGKYGFGLRQKESAFHVCSSGNPDYLFIIYCLPIHSILFNLLLASLSEDNTLWSHLISSLSLSLSIPPHSYGYESTIYLSFYDKLIFNVCAHRYTSMPDMSCTPFLQGSGSTGEVVLVAGGGMPPFSTNLGLGRLGPPQDLNGLPGTMGSQVFSHQFFRDHEFRTRYFLAFVCFCFTCVHRPCWFTGSRRNPNRIVHTPDDVVPEWMPATFRKWQRFQPH